MVTGMTTSNISIELTTKIIQILTELLKHTEATKYLDVSLVMKSRQQIEMVMLFIIQMIHKVMKIT